MGAISAVIIILVTHMVFGGASMVLEANDSRAERKEIKPHTPLQACVARLFSDNCGR